MKLTIIIPSYNEARTLVRVVKSALAVRIPYKKEIIIVDDGSTDQTLQVLKNLPKDKKLIIIINKQNLGKGASIVRALKKATGDLVLIQDADLEYNPSDIPMLLAPFKNNYIDVVYGSRVLGNNPISHWTFNFGGRVVTVITNFLYGTKITDEPTGYKVFRKDLLLALNLRSKGFEFCPEVTAKTAKKGIKIVEVPISYKPRSVSEKKINWRDGIAAIFYLFKYRFWD